MKQYTCDVQIYGKGTARGVVLWLSAPNPTEAKKAAQRQFGEEVVSVSNFQRKEIGHRRAGPRLRSGTAPKPEDRWPANTFTGAR